MEWRVLTSGFEVDRLYNRLSLTSSPCAEITNGEEQPTSEPDLVPSHPTPPALKTLVRCFLLPFCSKADQQAGSKKRTEPVIQDQGRFSELNRPGRRRMNSEYIGRISALQGALTTGVGWSLSVPASLQLCCQGVVPGRFRYFQEPLGRRGGVCCLPRKPISFWGDISLILTQKSG